VRLPTRPALRATGIAPTGGALAAVGLPSAGAIVATSGRSFAGSRLASRFPTLERIGAAAIALPYRRTGFLDAQVYRFVTDGIDRTTHLTGDPSGLEFAIEFTHEGAFFSCPRTRNSASGATTGLGPSGGTGSSCRHVNSLFESLKNTDKNYCLASALNQFNFLIDAFVKYFIAYD